MKIILIVLVAIFTSNVSLAQKLEITPIWKNIHPMIIGGTESKQNKWPFMVSLHRKSRNGHLQFDCGGSFIGERYVLTAAHCVEGYGLSTLMVSTESNDLLGDASQFVGVQNVYIHDQYNANTLANDIAILELNRALSKPKIELATQYDLDKLRHGDPLVTMGWGANKNRGPHVKKLVDVDIEYIDLAVCQNVDNYMYRDVETFNICAGVPEGGKDACQGDSGGPLIINENGQPKQVGIVSWGDECGKKGEYGVYANIPYFQTSGWITEKVSGVSYSEIQRLGNIKKGKHSVSFPIQNYSDQPFHVLSISDQFGSEVEVTRNTCLNKTLNEGDYCEITLDINAVDDTSVRTPPLQTKKFIFNTDHPIVKDFISSVKYTVIAKREQAL